MRLSTISRRQASAVKSRQVRCLRPRCMLWECVRVRRCSTRPARGRHVHVLGMRCSVEGGGGLLNFAHGRIPRPPLSDGPTTVNFALARHLPAHYLLLSIEMEGFIRWHLHSYVCPVVSGGRTTRVRRVVNPQPRSMNKCFAIQWAATCRKVDGGTV